MREDLTKLKALAGKKGVESVKSGMVLGLGSGSTAYFALKEISILLKENILTDIVGIPSSNETEQLARKLGIPISNLQTHSIIDLTIDGADEVDSDLNLIKGGGGALLREKIIAQASRYLLIIVDETKMSRKICSNYPVPVEVIPFALEVEAQFLKSLGGEVKLRRDKTGKLFVTDEGNNIIDYYCKQSGDPVELSNKLNQRAGVVETGLFLNLANEVIIAGKEGLVSRTK